MEERGHRADESDRLNAGVAAGEGVGVTGSAGFGGTTATGDDAGSTGGPESGPGSMTGGGAGIGGSEIAGGTAGTGGGSDDGTQVLLDAGVDPQSASDFVTDDASEADRGVGGGEGGKPAGGADWAGTTRTGQVGDPAIRDLDTPS